MNVCEKSKISYTLYNESILLVTLAQQAIIRRSNHYNMHVQTNL